jgi:hypothetical protein
MITVRLEKLKYIVEEMHVAFRLASCVSDPFLSRTLARHVFVRAENFVEHARGLRRPLNDAGHDVREFNKAKEAYASAFDEYFKELRHRLGAHVQDFDFGRRLELWNQVESVKIEFLFEGALEIYRNLAALNIGGYVAYIAPPEVDNSALADCLNQFQRELDGRPGVEMGTDPLAMTRNNTTAMLNMTPVHQRAGQLVLIRRWVFIQVEVRRRLCAYRRVTNILTERIATDIVSFCDCLVTRAVSSTALQAMEGLDKLVASAGQSSMTIDGFVAATNFDTQVQAARTLRDKLGAHIEIEIGMSLRMLEELRDAFDLDGALNFFALCVACFEKTCRSIMFLRSYLIDGNRIFGASMSQAPAVAYAPTGVPVAAPPPEAQEINDDSAYAANLRRWLDGDEDQRGLAKHFFFQAFLHSSVEERIEETEHFGASSFSKSFHEYRRGHRFIQNILTGDVSAPDFEGVLRLVCMCSPTEYALSEALVRYGRAAPPDRQTLICSALGDIGSAPHEAVRDYLTQRATSPIWEMRFQAAIAILKVFVKTEGLHRVNRNGHKKVRYEDLGDSVLQVMSDDERVVCLLAFASIFASRQMGHFRRVFHDEVGGLKLQLEAMCVKVLTLGGGEAREKILRKLLLAEDYVGGSLLLALELGHNNRLYGLLLDACCNGSVVAAEHDQSMMNLVTCFRELKLYDHALQLAKDIALRSPESLDGALLVVIILVDRGGSDNQATQQIDKIRRTYKTTAKVEACLSDLEARIQQESAAK